MSVSQADFAAMEKLYEDEHRKVVAHQAETERLNEQVGRIESLVERVLAGTEKLTAREVQVCRDCGETFPFDPDADRCEECAPREGGGNDA